MQSSRYTAKCDYKRKLAHQLTNVAVPLPLQMKDVGETFKKLGYYFATVLIGLFIHGGLTLPIIMCEFFTGFR